MLKIYKNIYNAKSYSIFIKKLKNNYFCIKMESTTSTSEKTGVAGAGEEGLKNISAFVVGSTGEVGKEVVKVLAEHPEYTKVTLIARREVSLPESDATHDYSKFTQKMIDFDKLTNKEELYDEAFKGHQVGFCSLGTTLKNAGGKEGFFKVDHDYVVSVAERAKENGTKHFSIVTSAGANSNSFFYYNEVKGKVEQKLREMNFDKLSIFRPGMLLCDRTETRQPERVLRNVFKMGDPLRWMSVETAHVAKAMTKDAMMTPPKEIPSVEIHYNGAINKIGKMK